MIPFVKNKRFLIRSLISVFIVIIMLFLSCCSGDSEKASVPDITPDPKSSPADEEKKVKSHEIGFHAEIIRTNGEYDYLFYPAFVFSDQESLYKYYEENKDNYDLDGEWFENPDEKESIFFNIIKKYDEDFFAHNQLICILMEDGTGCVKHLVERVIKNGNDIHVMSSTHYYGKDYVSTSDMAEWHILIEVSRADTGEIAPENIKVHNRVAFDLEKIER